MAPMQEEQVSTKGTLNNSSLDTDTGAAQGAMLLTVKAGKTLLRNHLALHQSLLPLSAGLSAAFLSVCLTSHQRLPRLLILILLLALAADQLTPDNDGQMLGYFGNVIWALHTKYSFNLVFTPEGEVTTMSSGCVPASLKEGGSALAVAGGPLSLAGKELPLL